MDRLEVDPFDLDPDRDDVPAAARGRPRGLAISIRTARCADARLAAPTGRTSLARSRLPQLATPAVSAARKSRRLGRLPALHAAVELREPADRRRSTHH